MPQEHDHLVRTASDQAHATAEAKERARTVLHADQHQDVRGELALLLHRALTPSILVVIGVLVFWVALATAGQSDRAADALLPVAVGLALSAALVEAVGVRAMMQRLEDALEREREQIRENRDAERDEVRALYRAKGFSEPLLSQVVDTLCADDERLLKVMMHEELGLKTEQLPHPLMVGVTTGFIALGSSLLVIIPTMLLPGAWHLVVVPCGTVVGLAALAWASCRKRNTDWVTETASWWIVAGLAGGVVYFLVRLGVR